MGGLFKDGKNRASGRGGNAITEAVMSDRPRAILTQPL